MPLLDISLHNETLYAIAAVVIILCGLVWLFGRWRA